jgi:hypothetical protein
MNPLEKRLQALHWLFSATGHWLLQSRNSSQPLPHGDDVNWKAIGKLAYFHNIEPILYWMVSNTGISMEIPNWLTQKWEEAYFGNFLRNEEYLGILKILLQECEKEGIPIIVLKGPALIGRIYKDPALRTLSDLDILCSPGDLHGIINIGRLMGYIMMDDGDDPAAAHHAATYCATSGTILEFHFMPYEVIQNHTKFMQLAWDRREWIDVGGIHCPVLCIEMELLFNLAHLVQHQFDASLKHFLDIAGLLVFYGREFEEDVLGILLRDFGLETPFALTTEFLSAVMGLPMMSQGLQLNPKESALKEFNVSLRDLLALLDEDRLLDVRGAVWNFRTAIGNREGVKNKVDYVVKTLLPFSGGLTGHEIRSSGDTRYFLHQCRFYLKRLFLTLRHRLKERPSNRQLSMAAERAAAKGRITRQLMKLARPRNP